MLFRSDLRDLVRPTPRSLFRAEELRPKHHLANAPAHATRSTAQGRHDARRTALAPEKAAHAGRVATGLRGIEKTGWRQRKRSYANVKTGELRDAPTASFPRSRNPVRTQREAQKQSPLPSRERARVRGLPSPFALSLSKGLMKWGTTVDRRPPARSVAARGHLLSGIAQKVGKEASPYCPPDPPVLALCGMRQRHTNASLALRRVCADDASTTAQHCALRSGQMGLKNVSERFNDSNLVKWSP